MKPKGCIYLHEITQTHVFGTARNDLDTFRKLFGDDSLKILSECGHPYYGVG